MEMILRAALLAVFVATVAATAWAEAHNRRERELRARVSAFTGHPFLVRRRGVGEPADYRSSWV